jgi:hypothetical protein
MWVLALLGSPFIVGALMGAAFARGRWSTVAVAAIGVVLGFGIVLHEYLSSPLSSAPYNGCSDCENYLGRWWQPSWTIPIVLIAYIFWLFGIGAGVWVRGLVRCVRNPAETSS